MHNRSLATALGLGTLVVAALVTRRRPKDVTADRAHATRTVTIRGEAHDLYERWRDLDNLNRVYRNVPVDIVADVPGERLEWRTLRRAPYAGGGSVTFVPAPGERGTQVRLALHVDGPSAPALAAFARLFGGSPPQIAMESLRKFKALAESGEIPQAVSA